MPDLLVQICKGETGKEGKERLERKKKKNKRREWCSGVGEKVIHLTMGKKKKKRERREKGEKKRRRKILEFTELMSVYTE